MKTRHLPPTDLARIAPLPTDEKVRQLRRFKLGAPPFTYKPVREVLPDLMDVSGSLLASTGPTPLSEIEARIRRAKTSPEGILQNLIVARSLHRVARAMDIKAFQRSFYSMTIGTLDQVRLWPDFYLIMDGKPWVPFFDTRRGNYLTELGRKFTYSLQHEHIRALDYEMGGVGLCIFQFLADEARTTKIHRHNEADRFSYEELERMIDETYRLWLEISDERTEERRRAASGSGPLI